MQKAHPLIWDARAMTSFLNKAQDHWFELFFPVRSRVALLRDWR
jgi:hypothetical protein